MSEIEARIARIVSDVFDVPLETVSLSTTRDDVKGWDSVNIIHLLMALEAEFAVTFSVEEAGELLSVALIIEILKEKGVQ